MIKNIIFDWSGTLSNDFIPVYEAIMNVFEKQGVKRISLDEFRKEFELPYMNFWHKYLPEITKEETEKLFAEEIYKVNEPKIYNGVKKLLNKLNKLNINSIVISSQLHEKVISEAKNYGIYNLFKEIKGGVHNKIEIIQDILKKNNFSSEETLYVADMTHDIDAGKKVSVTTIAVTYGYQSEDELKESNPDHIINKISELEKLL